MHRLHAYTLGKNLKKLTLLNGTDNPPYTFYLI